ncbi:MAG: NAD(P)/FAD-dependent oxidoreductase [Gemmobacter sp.]
MTRPDLIVMGAGVTGLAIAFAAARRGVRVRVVERDRIGAGASGGVVGALMPHAPGGWTPAKAFQLESLLMAEVWWAKIAAASGLPTGYARTGRLQPLADDTAIAAARARVPEAAILWQGRALWQVIPAAPGWSPASPTGWLIHDTLSARLNPMLALKSLAGAITAHGGRIETGEDPPQGAPVVWATGVAGLAALTLPSGRPAGVPVKGQAALLAFDPGPDAPQLYADSLHIVPHADGTVAVGSTSETTFEDPAATDALLDAVIARARLACPALAAAPVIARWAGLRPRATTRQPILGPWPGRPGHFVANGGFKIGFGIAPLVAEVMADLILTGQDRIPDTFRPLR